MPAWMPAALVAIACFAFYVAQWPHVSTRLDPLTGDEPFYVMTAISLLEDQDLDESNNYRAEIVTGASGPFTLYAFDDSLNPPDPLPADWNGWSNPPRLVGAHAATTDRPGLYTKHGIGLSALIAVPWALGGRFGANLIVMLAASLLVAQMFFLARASGAGAWLAAGISGGIAVAMPVGPYALLLFPEVPAALLLIYAIRRVAMPANQWWQWLAAGSAIGFLPWLHQRFAPTAVVLTVILAVRVARRRVTPAKAAFAIAPIAVGGVTLLTYNLWLYDQPLQRTEDHAGFSRVAGTINGGFGLLLDAQWGLLIVAPVMLLAIAAIPRWYVEAPGVARIALAALAPYLIVISAYKVWWGEWGPPGRYLVPVVPLAAGPLAAWLCRASLRGMLVAYGLWAVGMLLTIVGYRDPQRFYHHPDGVNQLVTTLGNQFHVDVQRFLVAFQFYTAAPFAARFWIGTATIVTLVLAARWISSDALRRFSAGVLKSLGKDLGIR
jgi:hypothetical protein